MERVLRARARLGEGPIWHAETGSLIWGDICDHRVHRFHPASGDDEAWDAGDVVGRAWPADDGRLLLALRRSLAVLDPRTGAIDTVAEVCDEPEGNRLNCAAADARGRLWFGSMSRREGGAALYCFEAGRGVQRVMDGITIVNGVSFSPDGGTLYFADSPAQRIFACDFDVHAGRISRKRCFADLAGERGFPDGAAVDVDGGLWSARFDGGCIVRYDRGGRETCRISLPVPRPTSCAFGGAELGDLYVTSASIGMSEEQIEAAHDSGDLFRVRTGARGLPATPVRLR